MTTKEIHEGMEQIHSEGHLSYATVKTWAAEFKQVKDRDDDSVRSSKKLNQ